MSAKLRSWTLGVVAVGTAVAFPAQSAKHVRAGAEVEQSGMMEGSMMGNQPSAGLLMPLMNPARGRELFASKGCVVCHSVNGVGGEDAPPLDASTMDMPMNPFEGSELADMIAFVHSPEEQQKFSEDDIPPRIKDLMRHMEGEEPHEEEGHEADRPSD